MENKGTSHSIDIPSWRVGEVTKKVAALNRKARKLGLPEATFTVGESRRVSHDHECPCCMGLRSDSWTRVEAGSEAIRIDGWNLVAILDHSIGEKPLIKPVSESEIPAHYREADANCDHCRMERRRKDTFILEKDGSYRQVGRTCLGDYLGENTAASIAAYAAWTEKFGELMDGELEPDMMGGYGEAMWDLVGFLEFTAVEIKENGWFSRTAARDNAMVLATADAVLATLADTAARDLAKAKLSDTGRADAKAAVEWAANVNADNDYLHSIRVLAEAGQTNQRNAGFAASILNAYRRDMERKAEREAEAKASAGHYGELKERAKGVTVALVSMFTSEGYYGTSFIYKLRTAEGHTLTWFASSPIRHQMEDGEEPKPGTEMVVDFTVKKHGEFRGVPETTVNRVSVKKVLSPEDIEAEMHRMEAEADRAQTERDERNKHEARKRMEQIRF